MSDKLFLDTNLFVYLISSDMRRKNIVRDIILSDMQVCISTQVLSEFASTCTRKKLLGPGECIDIVRVLSDSLAVMPVDAQTVIKSLELIGTHSLSFWDGMIAAAAILNQCTVLYSEDMQHGYLLENQVRILNPFV